MRARSRHRTLAALAAVLVVAAACSSPQGTEQPENSLLGKDKRGRKAADDGKKDGGRGSRGKTKTGAAGAVAAASPTLVPPAPGETAPANSGAAKTDTKVTSTGTDPRRASVLVTEPDPDAEKSGLVPDYSEIVSVRIQGQPAGFRATMTFRGELPEKMPDDKTYMIVGMGLTESKEDDDDAYAFGASAGTSGWEPYAGNKTEGGEYQGTFSIEGTTAVFTVPWSAIGGPRPFKWYSQASWFKSLAGTTHYSLDIVPNEGPARFPAG